MAPGSDVVAYANLTAQSLTAHDGGMAAAGMAGLGAMGMWASRPNVAVGSNQLYHLNGHHGDLSHHPSGSGGLSQGPLRNGASHLSLAPSASSTLSHVSHAHPSKDRGSKRKERSHERQRKPDDAGHPDRKSSKNSGASSSRNGSGSDGSTCHSSNGHSSDSSQPEAADRSDASSMASAVTGSTVKTGAVDPGVLKVLESAASGKAAPVEGGHAAPPDL